MTIGKRIRQARKNAGLTQQELAKKINLSRSYIGDLEIDRYNPSVQTLQMIANATDVSLASLLGDPTPPTAMPSAEPQKQNANDPVADIFDDPDIRGLARRNFETLPPKEAEELTKEAKNVLRFMFRGRKAMQNDDK